MTPVDFVAKKTTIEANPVPRPYPNYDRLPDYHYLPIERTPTMIDGNLREPDDFQPRAQLKKMFSSDGGISINDVDKISVFSKKYICDEKYVSEYINHLHELKFMKEKRQMATKDKKLKDSTKSVHDFKWKEMLKNNELCKLQPSVLDKYIDHHKLEKKKLKKDKISVISSHLLSLDTSTTCTKPSKSNKKTYIEEDLSDVSEDENDYVLAKYDSSDMSDVLLSSDSDTDLHVPVINKLTTRGRQVKAPRKMQDYYTCT